MSDHTAASPVGGAATQSESAALLQAWKVFRITCLGVWLTYLSQSSLAIVLPGIVDDLGGTTSQANWVLLAYMLAMAVGVLVLGSLGDLMGRSGIYLAGLGLFIIASLACAFSPSMGWLIAARVAQGIGAAAVITNTTALLTDVFPKSALTIGLGFNTTSSALSQLAGPAIGGSITTAFGWQAVFLFNLPFGLLALWLALRLLPWRDFNFARAKNFDVGGSAAFAAALCAILVTLSSGSAQGWSGLQIAAGLGVSALAFGAFVLIEGRVAQPLLDLRIFRRAGLRMNFIVAFLNAMVFHGSVLMAALHLRSLLNLSAMEAGFLSLFFAFGMMIGAPLSGYAARRAEPWRLSTLGLLLSAAGTAALSAGIALEAGTLPMTAAYLLTGLGYGIFLTPNTATIMRAVDAETRGAANGIRSAANNTGLVAGAAVMLTIAALVMGADHRDLLYTAATSEAGPEGLLALRRALEASLGFASCVALCAAVALWSARRHFAPSTTTGAP